MTYSFELPYGESRLTFDTAEVPRMLSLPEVPVNISPQRFSADLDPWLEAVDRKMTVAIVVADKTRLCEYDRYLPVLLGAFRKRGVLGRNMAAYIAYGTHSPQSERECRSAYGAAWNRIRFVHHDCRDKSLFHTLGTTRRGTPVYIQRDIFDADFVITFGAISHHYFAGYGGGRKLIFPGLGYRRAIECNHALFLDRANRELAAGCRPGRILGNPLAEDLAEVEAFYPADLAIHAIVNDRGRVCQVITGRGAGAFKRACDIHAAYTEVDEPERYDLVLASCGGYPKDINLIQSHKAIHNAAMFVKDGGTLVVLAQCCDGVGSDTFLPWFQYPNWHDAFDRLAGNYQGNGGTALSLMAKSDRISIRPVTDLNPDIVDRIGLEHLSYEAAFSLVRDHSGPVTVIANAARLVKACRNHSLEKLKRASNSDS